MLNLINATIDKSWPILGIIMLIYCMFRFFRITSSKKRVRLFEEFYHILCIVYVFLLSSIMSFGKLNVTSGINLIPFKEIFRYTLFSDLFMLNIIGNMVLFAPLGYFTGYYLKTRKTSIVLLVSGIISFAGELMQRYVGRTFDIDDIILNVAGAVIGFLIYRCLYNLYRKLPNMFQKDGLYNIVCIIIIFVLIFYVLDVIGVVNVL